MRVVFLFVFYTLKKAHGRNVSPIVCVSVCIFFLQYNCFTISPPSLPSPSPLPTLSLSLFRHSFVFTYIYIFLRHQYLLSSCMRVVFLFVFYSLKKALGRNVSRPIVYVQVFFGEYSSFLFLYCFLTSSHHVFDLKPINVKILDKF